MPKLEKEVIDDIKSLTKYFKGVLKEPKHSDKAGEIFSLFKQLNTVLLK